MATTYDTSYYDNAFKEFEEKQKISANKQKVQTEQEYNNRLKQAYISNKQTERATSQALAQAGIRGGMTETSALKNAANYQNTTNSLQAEKTKAFNEIDKNANDNIFAYKQTNDAAKNAYIEGRQAEDRATAAQAAADQKEANITLWTAQYGGYTDVKELQSKLSGTTDPNEQAIIQARINYLNEEAADKAATENTSYLESKYNGYTSVSKLKTALSKAKTTEEKTIIQNRINTLNEETESTKEDRYTALYSKYYNIDNLRAALANTTDPIIKKVINERIGYLYSKKKGY